MPQTKPPAPGPCAPGPCAPDRPAGAAPGPSGEESAPGLARHGLPLPSLSRRHLLLAPAGLALARAVPAAARERDEAHAQGRAARRAVPLAATPLSRMDLPWWARRHHEKVAEMRDRRPALVWLGDSITQNFEHDGPAPLDDYAPVWRRFYGDRRAVNLGFMGDATAHVLWRAESAEFDGTQPRLIVLLVGANNLGRVHWDAPDSLQGIAAILAALRRRMPQTQVLLLSVLPRAGDAWVIDTRVAINRGLRATYGEGPGVPGVRYVDLTGLFERDGRIDDALYRDPSLSPPRLALHPTPAGMALIAETIEPEVARILGDRVHRAA